MSLLRHLAWLLAALLAGPALPASAQELLRVSPGGPLPTVGAARKQFVLQGRTIKVKDGVCVAPDGTLAGSDLDMGQAVRNAMSMLGLTFAEAAAMASQHPARFLGRDDLGVIAPGRRASLVLLDDAFNVQATWIDGVASDAATHARAKRASEV